MSNLKLEPADSPCQRDRLFVKLCWDGFVYLRNCFFPLVVSEALNHHLNNHQCAMRKLNFPMDNLKSGYTCQKQYWLKLYADCKWTVLVKALSVDTGVHTLFKDLWKVMLCLSALLPLQKIKAEVNIKLSQCFVPQKSRIEKWNLAAGEQMGIIDQYNTNTERQGKVQGILRE